MSNVDITVYQVFGVVLTEGIHNVRDLTQQAEEFHSPT